MHVRLVHLGRCPSIGKREEAMAMMSSLVVVVCNTDVFVLHGKRPPIQNVVDRARDH